METRLKTGGRKFGVPNRVSATIKERITAIIESNIESFESDLASLEPKERLTVLIKLLEFTIPKTKVLETEPFINRVKIE